MEDRDELDRYVASPVIRVYHYGSVERGSSNCYSDYYTKLEELRRQVCFCDIFHWDKPIFSKLHFNFLLLLCELQCMSTLDRKNDDHQSLRNTKRMLNRMHENILFCAESLGLYGVLQVGFSDIFFCLLFSKVR